MKNKIIKFTGVLILSISSFSAFTQINYQGSLNLDAYYGFPNFGKSYYSILETSSSTSAVTGIGPAGLRGEYFLSDDIGLGFDIIYNSAREKSSVSQTNTIYNNTTQLYETSTTITDRERLMQRVRLMIKLNVHIETSNPNLDLYFGFGAGTSKRYEKYWVNGNSQPVNNKYYDLDFFVTLPISARLDVGLRYYFNEKIGVNLEFGIGGPLISAGISLKLK